MPINNPLIKLQINQDVYQNLGGKKTVEVQTSALTPNQIEALTAPLGKTFLLFRVQTSHPARVRIYATPAYRDSDLNRPIGVRVAGELGLILEAITTRSNLELDLAPIVWGANLAPEPSRNVALSITSLDTSASVQITLRLLSIEAEI